MRAFAVSAVVAAVGAMIAVLPLEGAGRIALIVVGALLIVGAAVLIGLAIGTSRRQRVTIALDEAGYRVDSPAGVRTGTWADVTRVTAAPGRITLHQGDQERVHLVAPDGQLPQFEAITQAISQRLDDDRGYKVWTG